jgi:GPH family glycoside/pentoside/hexuronide:cation symporter
MEGPRTTHVSTAARTALGVGTLASFFGYVGIYSMATPVYQMTLGVNPGWLGVALCIPRLLDAFFDPVMGKISDNTRSRWGRRRPYIVLGAVLMGITYGMVWMVPAGWSDLHKLVYFVLSSTLFFVGYTIFGVPYSSLTYEITPDYHERTSVMAFCSFFQKAGELVYQFIFPLSQMAVFASKLQGVRVVNWMVGLVFMMGVGMLPGLLVRERFQHVAKRQEPVKLWDSVGDALRYRPFFILIILTVLNVLAGMFASSLDYYVLVYYMFDGNLAGGSWWKGFLSAGYAVVGFVAIPLVVWISRRLGKRRALVAIYGLTFAGGVAKWFVFSPSHPWLIFFDPVLCGPIWIAVNVLMASMLADICDEDELVSGQRREGMFGAIFSWVQKMAVSLSFLGTGLTLQLSGFDQKLGGHQSSGTFTVMRLFLAGSASVTAVLAMVALRYYTLTAGRAAETRQVLEARRSKTGGPSPAGLTGAEPGTTPLQQHPGPA